MTPRPRYMPASSPTIAPAASATSVSATPQPASPIPRAADGPQTKAAANVATHEPCRPIKPAASIIWQSSPGRHGQGLNPIETRARIAIGISSTNKHSASGQDYRKCPPMIPDRKSVFILFALTLQCRWLSASPEDDAVDQRPSLDRAAKLEADAYQALRLHDAARAEPFARRALEMKESLLPPGDLAIGISSGILALCYEGEEKYDLSVKYYRRALEIAEARYGPNDPKIARIILPLASVLKAQRKYTDAEVLLRRARNSA